MHNFSYPEAFFPNYVLGSKLSLILHFIDSKCVFNFNFKN